MHVWKFQLDGSDAHALAALLSPDESERAARFKFECDRDRYIVGRAMLRRILSGYLQIANPTSLAFSYGNEGKPALVNSAGLQFNLAHSQGAAVLAVSLDHAVGIDIEHIRPDIELDDLARLNFSAAEQIVFFALAAQERAQAFYNCWTRKEAVLKAHGGGLSVPLKLFDVTLAPGEPARILKTRPPLPSMQEWSLCSFDPGEDCAAAIAVAAPQIEMQVLKWGN